MAIPFASAYAPINLLNDAIQNQAARQQQGYLQASALNDASVADSLNRIVQQKALEQQFRDRQQHYGLQQQQLANDLAYRNAVLKEAEMRAVQQGNQFDKQFGLNERIANAQINNPFYGQRDLGLGLLQRNEDASRSNAETGSLAGNANQAIKNLKADADAKIGEILTVWSHSNPLTHPLDVARRIYTSEEDWAKQIRAIKAKYRADVLSLAQMAPGKLTIKNKVDPKTGQEIEDEFEAVPVTMPQIQFPNMVQPQPQAAPQTLGPLLTQPQTNAVPPPFMGWGLQGTNTTGGSNQNAVPKAVVSPGVTNRVFRFDPQRGLVPLQ